MWTKSELIGIFESVGLAIPTFIQLEGEMECVWYVDDEDRREEAEEIKQALSTTVLRRLKIFTTIGMVMIYVRD